MVREVETIERNLESIGIEMSRGGSVEITDAFEKALQSDIDTVRSTLTGREGFFTKVSAELDKVLENGASEYALGRDTSTAFVIDVYA